MITDIINIHEFINETLLFYIYTFNPFQLFMCCLINLQAEGLLNEVGLFSIQKQRRNWTLDAWHLNFESFCFDFHWWICICDCLQIETEHLFGNISDVLTVNCDFWESHLLKVLLEARENRTPLNPSDMKDGFKRVK